jgi:hypothetical protein
MITPSYKRVMAAVTSRGYLWFRGAMDLNIIGLRNPEPSGDKFDDTICVAYVDVLGNDIIRHFPATTDPGMHYAKNPINPSGLAILALGQHRGIWTIGKHRGSPALVQIGRCKVIRDNNRDSYRDYDAEKSETGIYGINLHSVDPYDYQTTIGRWSAGCQVLPMKMDKDYIINMVRLQGKVIGTTTVSYTLLLESDA